ncbi:hypothetical protein PENSPDRAFT_752692 [Peniophora sp. CONT]|nr:hypothetical protein PENSPDRAFT_752692 [Peniophora sp. CONT]
MSSASDGTVALQEATEELWLRAVPLLVESILFGVFSLLFLASAYLLLQRGLKLWANAFMLGVVLVMYASSLAYLLVDFISFLDTARDPLDHYETSPHEFKRQSIGITICLGVNFLLSDAIVLWRAVIFWSGNKVIAYISAAMLFTSLVLGVVDVATDRNDITEWGGTPVSVKIPQATMNGFGIAMIVVSLVANFWATGLIAVKAWRFRQLVRATGNRRSGVRFLFMRFLQILSVAGVAYSALWIAFIGISINATTTLNSIIWQLALENAVTMCTGIYPTAVVALVSLQIYGANVEDFEKVSPPEGRLAAPTLTQTADIHRTGLSYTVHTSLPEPDSSSSRSEAQEKSHPWDDIQLRPYATHSSNAAGSSSHTGSPALPSSALR